VLLESGEELECQKVLHQLRSSSFSAVQAGRIFLESKIDSKISWDESLQRHLHPAFVERFGTGSVAFSLLRDRKVKNNSKCPMPQRVRPKNLER
jgi:hypothetical protein